MEVNAPMGKEISTGIEKITGALKKEDEYSR
jgi:hypothetical protein